MDLEVIKSYLRRRIKGANEDGVVISLAEIAEYLGMPPMARGNPDYQRLGELVEKARISLGLGRKSHGRYGNLYFKVRTSNISLSAGEISIRRGRLRRLFRNFYYELLGNHLADIDDGHEERVWADVFGDRVYEELSDSFDVDATVLDELISAAKVAYQKWGSVPESEIDLFQSERAEELEHKAKSLGLWP